MARTILACVNKPSLRIGAGVLLGLLILTGVVWLLANSLGNFHDTLYADHSLSYWKAQLEGRDAAASNQAAAVVNAQVIPQLIDPMFHDTNDSQIRLGAVHFLNDLPGIQISYVEADSRRILATEELGELGPAAKAAVPALIQALKSSDTVLHEPAIRALGKIHSDPDVVIPLLIPYLTNDEVNDDAATALANYGKLAKAAVPNIIPLLHAKDDDARKAARVALKKIDPEAAASAGVK
jgi:HEAT repeat protein